MWQIARSADAIWSFTPANIGRKSGSALAAPGRVALRRLPDPGVDQHVAGERDGDVAGLGRRRVGGRGRVAVAVENGFDGVTLRRRADRRQGDDRRGVPAGDEDQGSGRRQQRCPEASARRRTGHGVCGW